MRSEESDEMKRLAQNLQLLSPVISEICQVSGSAGTSIGVAHRGKVVLRLNLGYRDVENQIAPDSDTVYPIASLTKSMTAASFGVLVHDGQLSWDDLVAEVYPDFLQANDTVREKATITDLLAHRTGLAGKNCYWHQSRQQLLTPKEETASTISILESVAKFREDFFYNNLVYSFAGVVLERIARVSFGTFIHKKIFEPLGLRRTTIGPLPVDNVAKSYQTLDNGTSWPIPTSNIQDNTIMGSAGGAKSTVNDLLTYFGHFLSAANHQISTNSTSTEGSPFRELPALVQNHILASTAKPNNQFYGLGLVVAELPSTLGLVGLNPRELGDEMPVIARSTKTKTRVWYHNGSLPGAFSAVYLLPDTETVIVVLSNSLGRTDTPDWIGQLLVEAVTEEENPHDFVQIAKKTRDIHLSQYPKLQQRMDDAQPVGTPVKPLKSYEGRYYNSIGTFFVDVAAEGEQLRMWSQGYKDVDYHLYHYDHDIFAWAADRDHDVKMAIFPKWYEGFHKVEFHTNPAGDIDRLSWGHDGAVPSGEVFQKQTANAMAASQQKPLDKPT